MQAPEPSAGGRKQDILRQALKRKTPQERAVLLDGACGGDDALRTEIDALLAIYEEAERDRVQNGEADNAPPGEGTTESTPTLLDETPVTEGPGTVIGRYKLLEQIGEGGFGVVYMAEQREPVKRRVAMKIIKLGMDTRQVVARFEAERQSLALMDHPNIAKVFDAGATETGRPYFVMELVRGVRITDYCDRNNLPTGERLDLFLKICQAIQHAHQKGIIHRDIKPSNILVTLHDGVPVPKVIDFGIAKATAGQTLTDKTLVTAFEQFLGTPAYMSPEQAEMSGLDIDTRSDIYSLGVLLYELLAGSTPFDAKELLASGIDAMRKTIREKEPVRPSTRLATLQGEELTTTARRRSMDAPKLLHLLKGDLDWIVMKCLEKDRTRRYETANGLARDIERHLNNEPVVARPPSTAYRLQKAWRRNKVVFTAAVVVVGALVVGIGVSSWQAIVASRARNAETQQRLAAQTERDKAQTERSKAQAAQKEAEQLLYLTDMNLAQQAWDRNNIGLLRQMLEETQDSPYRGFEWYYWQRQTHLASKTLRGHHGAVASVAYSPDGQRIVTGSLDGTAKVWEAASGKELLALKGQSGPVRPVAFSPDGQRIVTGSGGTVKVFEATSGRELLTLKGHSNQVWSAAFSADGQRIVSASEDKTAKVWDAASGRELLTLKGHSGSIVSVAFSPDGQRIVTGSGDTTAKVWDASSGKELLTLNKGETIFWIFSVAFSPDGQRIVTGSADGTAKVWEAANGHELFTLKGHTGHINSVAFSPDGLRIVSGSSDQTAKIWEAASGKELVTLVEHSDGILCVAFSPDGQQIVTGSEDKTAKVWDAASSKDPHTLKGHGDVIGSVAFSPDSQRIVTASDDSTAKVWDATSGKELLTLTGHTNAINSAAFSPDGRRIVTGSDDRLADVWDAASGRKLLTLQGHSDQVYPVRFSPDGQRIVTGSSDSTAKVWEAASGRELLTLKGHNGRIQSVAYSPDGQQIVTGSFDATAKLWDAASGKELLTLKGHSGAIYSVAFSPDGQRIVTGSYDRTAKVWEAASGKELVTLKGHAGGILSVAFSPDGQRIVSGSGADHTAKVWEAASGRELLTLKGHSGYVYSVAFSPDGQRIATGSGDNTAKVWVAARAEQVAAWREEERAQERERIVRARDSIKQWLILAPIALASGQSGAEGLDIEQIEGEARLRPKAGETRSIGGGELKWRAVALTNEVIDFNAILGHETTQSVAYAVCYLRSETEQRGLQMLVGSDDEAKVYLNGKEVYKSSVPRMFVAEEDKVPDIALNAGLNVLVFKVVNEAFDWMGSIRFTHAQGNPVRGIKVTLDPEAKGFP